MKIYTLIFLSVAGITALSDLYRPKPRNKPQWEDKLSDALLTLSPQQHIESFKYSVENLLDSHNRPKDKEAQAGPVTLLYDYRSDSSVEVSDLTVSLLDQLSRGETLNRVIAEFKKKLDDKEAQERLKWVLTDLVRILYEKGFVSVVN